MARVFRNGVPVPFYRLNTRQQQEAIRKDRIAAMNGDTEMLDLLDQLNKRAALAATPAASRGQPQLRKR